MNEITYQQHTTDLRDSVPDIPVCVVATGLLVDDINVVGVGNVVPAVVTPVADVVTADADFMTIIMHTRCNLSLIHI